MTQTGQAMADQSSTVSAGGGGIKVANASGFLLSSAKAAVSEALGSADPTRKSGSHAETGTTGNRPDSPGNHTWNSGVTAPVVSLPPSTVPAMRMVTLRALQEWEGYVVSIDDDEFVARLVDVTAGMSYDSEEAIIPLDELSDRDATSMTVGSIFRWVIGYERSPEGTRKRVSQIVFRDLPRMTDGDLQAGREWACKMVPGLNP